MKLMTVTPSHASKWLKNHKNPRPLSQAVVARYKQDIASGTWHETGDVIRFDEDGNLIDGQHRLEAVIQTGKPIESWVFTGARATVVEAIDTGRKRSLADLLRLRGEKHYSSVAAVIVLIHQHEQGAMNEHRVPPLSNSHALSLLAKHPGIRSSVALVVAKKAVAHLPGTVLAFVHYMGAKTHKQLATDWLAAVQTGAGCETGDPALLLRNWAIGFQVGERAQRPVQIAMAIKSWLSYRDGSKLGRLAWQGYGARAEKMPAFPGYGAARGALVAVPANGNGNGHA